MVRSQDVIGKALSMCYRLKVRRLFWSLSIEMLTFSSLIQHVFYTESTWKTLYSFNNIVILYRTESRIANSIWLYFFCRTFYLLSSCLYYSWVLPCLITSVTNLLIRLAFVTLLFPWRLDTNNFPFWYNTPCPWIAVIQCGYTPDWRNVNYQENMFILFSFLYFSFFSHSCIHAVTLCISRTVKRRSKFNSRPQRLPKTVVSNFRRTLWGDILACHSDEPLSCKKGAVVWHQKLVEAYKLDCAWYLILYIL